MSVLKSKRAVSKAEYLNTANEIYTYTLAFLTRMSSRYARLMAQAPAKLAAEVMDETEKANSIYPSDDTRRGLRKGHLLEARAALQALDVELTHCYIIMSQNAAGCFTTAGGKEVSESDAMRRLDNMAQELGSRIDHEKGLIDKVMESDKRRK